MQAELTGEMKAGLERQLKDLEAAIKSDPDDAEALEAAAVTATNLGQFARAEHLLTKLTAVKKEDPQVWRLLAEVCVHIPQSLFSDETRPDSLGWVNRNKLRS
jgi:Flp pilus assembly protein TadD